MVRDILDPGELWIGSFDGGFAASNKPPVVPDRSLTLLQDSAPVSVDVLSTAFDPEGEPLTLISASAALGSAVAEPDNTVTYTPPPGLAGFDAVVYELADDLDQRSTGQINVTLTAPQLAVITQVDNTLAVTAETGPLDIEVTSPMILAVDTTIEVGDLTGGPINLVPPAIEGTKAPGLTVTARPGLWTYDAEAGAPVRSWHWLRDGAEIPGATGASYVVDAADMTPDLTLREVQTDAFGQRLAFSAPVPAATFTPALDGAVLAWYDASDETALTASDGLVEAWLDLAGGDDLVQANTTRRPRTGARSLNGRNLVDFDGGDFLERASLTLPANGDLAVHMALDLDGVDNAFAAVLAFDALNDMQLDANDATSFFGRLNPNGIGAPVTLSGGPFSGPLILSMIFDQTGSGTAEVFIADQSRATMAYTAPIDALVALHLMTNRSRNASVNGAVGEVVITGATGNRGDYHGYLSSKWGVT